MKLTMYMAFTLNGMIAKTDGNSEWVSEEDTLSFKEFCKSIGTVIMGKNTYDVLYPDDLPLTEGLQIVLTSKTEAETENPTIIFSNKTPKEILLMLEGKGIDKACIIGGTQTITSFMKEGLIDELYIDIEPLLFGKGMPVFAPSDFEYELELIELKKLNANTVQLHYNIKK